MILNQNYKEFIGTAETLCSITDNIINEIYITSVDYLYSKNEMQSEVFL